DDLWTPDGEYIVINSSKTGGCMVHPDPWQVVALGKRLVNHLEDLEQRRVYRDAPDSYPYLLVQPYPGWVSLCIRFVTGKKPNLQGRGRLMEARNYLVDYKGKHFLPMDSLDSPDDIWTMTITPDGQKRVYFKHSIFLDETPFHLPGNTPKYVPLNLHHTGRKTNDKNDL
ncbi:MAG: hypothetical protein U9N77_03075, partial [Thermodesulfobacteriota bacterium]|nr:hypothetical protein [Thermodesulfobacteriota bacterium]